MGLLGGLIGFIKYLSQREEDKNEQKQTIENVQEINDFTIERDTPK